MKKPVENSKLRILGQIYALFDETMGIFNTVCREKCAACCTCNVTMTGLEAALILDDLPPEKQAATKARILARLTEKRYRPLLTTNMFARTVMAGDRVPDEDNDPSWGVCPLLENDACTIYPHRPFGCRALLSQAACHENGEARVPPLAMTYLDIFMQAIEHLDAGGIFGNLSDVLLLALSGQKNRKDTTVTGPLLLTCESIPVLMVPPEHRQQTAQVVSQLSRILS